VSPRVRHKRPAVGIDVGLKVFLADSDGTTVENPRFFRTSQATLRRKQHRLCARRKGSQRRRKMARSVAQTHLKIERQRRDFHFAISSAVANANTLAIGAAQGLFLALTTALFR
jgi:putative transposase